MSRMRLFHPAFPSPQVLPAVMYHLLRSFTIVTPLSVVLSTEVFGFNRHWRLPRLEIGPRDCKVLVNDISRSKFRIQ